MDGLEEKADEDVETEVQQLFRNWLNSNPKIDLIFRLGNTTDRNQIRPVKIQFALTKEKLNLENVKSLEFINFNVAK